MIFVLAFLLTSNAHALTKVPVAFIEALAPRDSTSSEKFKADFEGSIQLGKSLTAESLKKCGFELETKTSFYDAGDALQAKELAAKEEKSGTWLLVGPRRSNHYIAMVKGSEQTPSVSLMAGSSEVEALGSLHVTLSPFNQQMAEVAAKEALKRIGKNRTYVSIVSGDCLTCVDFAESFDKKAKIIGLKKLEQFTISGEEPDTSPFKEKIGNLNPAFILLPNYSKASVKVMNGLDGTFGGIYVGADGWGDSKFGFVQKGAKSDVVQGFTVRGFPIVLKGLENFDLGKKVLVQSQVQPPQGGPALAALKILDWTKNVLCEKKPKNKESFVKNFQTKSNSLNAPWGVSVYELKNGEIVFKNSVLTKKVSKK